MSTSPLFDAIANIKKAFDDMAMKINKKYLLIIGEYLDIVAGPNNGFFGYHHNLKCMKYGISPPLEEFHTELKKILESGPSDGGDDKTPLRQRSFEVGLENEHIRDLFQIYTIFKWRW